MSTQVNENPEVFEKYLQKRNRNTKIFMAVCLSLALILIASILTLSFLKVDLRPKFMTEAGQEYLFVVDGSEKERVDKTDVERFEKITSLLDKTFTTSLLSAIFSNQTNRFDFEDSYTKFSQSDLTTKNYLNCKSYLQVSFGSQRYDVTQKDGKPYYPNKNKTQKLQFDEFYIALPEGNQNQEITIVIPSYGNYINGGNVDENTATLSKLTINANVFSLRNLLKDLI